MFWKSYFCVKKKLTWSGVKGSIRHTPKGNLNLWLKFENDIYFIADVCLKQKNIDIIKKK